MFPDWVNTGPDGYRRLTFRGFEALTVEALRELKSSLDKDRKPLKFGTLVLFIYFTWVTARMIGITHWVYRKELGWFRSM